MSVIKNYSNFIKYGSYIYDDSSCRVIGAPNTSSSGPVIKACQTALSYAEKYRLGILTYPEYLMWQTQIMLGLAETEAPTSIENNSEFSERVASENSDSAGRFWENDSGIRQNVSSSDYERFLAENSINVSNNASVDIAGIIENIAPVEEASAPVQAETDVSEVLRNVNRDIKGSDVLSEEEIAALFAAAGN